MAREFFKNSPNTTTPLTAPRLNALLDGDEPIGNIKVDSIQTKNMIGGWFYGGLSASTGEENTTSTSRRTDYIEVDFSKFSQYKISGMPVQKCSWFVAAYNSNKQFLGRTNAFVQTTTTSSTLNTTSFSNGTAQGTGDIKYLKVTLYAPVSGYTTDQIISDYSTIQLETGGSATDYSEYKGIGYVSGSNENGHYVKYDDGRLEQWGSIKLTNLAITNTTSSGVYRSDWQRTITYPLSFKDIPEIYQLFPIFASTGFWVEPQGGSVTKNNTSGYFVLSHASTTEDVEIGFLAIGRWK